MVSRECSYWKEATTASKKDMSSDCHLEVVEALIILPKCTKDIGELQCVQRAAESAKNLKMFLLVLKNHRFPARHSLPLRCDGDETNNNLFQLLCLHAQDCSDLDVDAWL